MFLTFFKAHCFVATVWIIISLWMHCRKHILQEYLRRNLEGPNFIKKHITNGGTYSESARVREGDIKKERQAKIDNITF